MIIDDMGHIQEQIETTDGAEELQEQATATLPAEPMQGQEQKSGGDAPAKAAEQGTQSASVQAEPEAQSPDTPKQDSPEEAQSPDSWRPQPQEDSESQSPLASGGDAPAQASEGQREQVAPVQAESEAQSPDTPKQDSSEEAQSPDSRRPQPQEDSESQSPLASGGDAPAQASEGQREQVAPAQAESVAQSPDTPKQDSPEEAQSPDSRRPQPQEDSESQSPLASGGDASAQASEGQREQVAPAQAESESQAPEPAQPKRGRGRPKRPMPSDLEILQALAAAFGEIDLECPDDFGIAMADGKWHRCRCVGQDCSNIYDGNGEYLLEWDGRQSSILAYNFAGHKWVYRRYHGDHGRMTRAERREQERAFQKRMAERLRQDKADADEAASRAQAEWERVPELDKVCGYLEAKGLADVYGLRGTAGQILVPLRNEGGELRALQTITRKDGGFEKRFTRGCKMPGLFFEFPEDDSGVPVCIGEGLATVATVVDAMQWHGLAAMNCGNLDAVVGIARRRWPERQIIVLADNDAIWNANAGGARPHRKGDRRPEEENSGIVKARAAAQKYGVKLAVPPVVDGKCTDFNDVYVRKGGGAAGAEAVQAAVEAAQYVPGCPTPAGFELRLEAGPAGEPGLYALKDGKAGPETVLVGPPLLVEGHVRNSRGGGWGLLVSWRDPDGRDKRISLTRASMASRDRPWLQELVDAGFLANSAQAPDLLKYLESSRPARRFLSPAKTGWLDDGISSFVLPDRVIGAPDGVDPADIVYSGPVTAMYRRAGTLEEWKRHAAILAAGNAKMTFGLCAAFAGPLLHAVGAANAGFHFVGPSSSGKSTIVQLAHSVWDDFDSMGTWRSTDNGKESEALSRNDTLLCLDEINQANTKVIGAVVYMLGNGQGKTRSKKNGELREQKKFRLIFLSSGEASLESIITSSGGTHMAGMDVRAVHVPVDKHDVADVHGLGSAGALCGAVKAVARRCYGTAGPAFVERLLPILVDKNSEIQRLLHQESLQKISADIIRNAGYDADASDPQIKRISETIALVCVAGLLAVHLGILPESIDARSACIKVMRDCIEFRGGISSHEEIKIVDSTATFLISNTNSMFIYVDNNGTIVENKGIKSIAGFKRHKDGVLHYYVLPDVMHAVWNGIAINEALQVLEKNGFIIPSSSSRRGRRHYQQLVTIPGNGARRWMYCLKIPDAEGASNE